jgi:rSAM/selenodomain-associated transferase 1
MAERRRLGALPPLLIIMVKQPVMGRVKTRLARQIGLAAATRFARISARTTILRLSRDRRWQTVLAIAPERAISGLVFPGVCLTIGQGRGDLGERMARLLALPSRPALLIGADIPAVSPAIIADAFRLLRSNDAVFGPAEDGGYWLVGLNRRAMRRDVFANVRWSTPHALTDTLANLSDVRIGYAARLSDVDDGESCRRWGSLAARVTPPALSPAAWSD